MGAVSVFTTGNYHCQLLLQHGSRQCQLEDKLQQTNASYIHTQPHTLGVKTYKPSPPMMHNVQGTCNTRIHVPSTQGMAKSTRYKCAGVCNGGMNIGAAAKNG